MDGIFSEDSEGTPSKIKDFLYFYLLLMILVFYLYIYFHIYVYIYSLFLYNAYFYSITTGNFVSIFLFFIIMFFHLYVVHLCLLFDLYLHYSHYLGFLHSNLCLFYLYIVVKKISNLFTKLFTLYMHVNAYFQ